MNNTPRHPHRSLPAPAGARATLRTVARTHRLRSARARRGIQLLTLCLLAAAPLARAAQVSFWFGGVIQDLGIVSNSVPAGIAVGKPFTGYVAYDSAGWNSTNLASFPAGQVGDYYYTDAAKMKMVLQMGGHTFVNSNNPGGYYSGLVEVQDQFNNNDAFYAETGSAVILMDGATWLHPPDSVTWNVTLSDDTKTTYSSVNIPTNPPSLTQFPDSPMVGFYAYTSDGQESLFSIVGEITSITSTEQIMLNFRRVTPTQITLAWPLVASGFTLQSRTNLATGDWQNVVAPVMDDSTDHTVSLPVGNGNIFFRLKK